MLAIDYKTLESLVINEEVTVMQLLVKSLVQYTGRHTKQENSNILVHKIIQSSDTKASSLELGTFVQKVLE